MHDDVSTRIKGKLDPPLVARRSGYKPSLVGLGTLLVLDVLDNGRGREYENRDRTAHSQCKDFYVGKVAAIGHTRFNSKYLSPGVPGTFLLSHKKTNSLEQCRRVART